MPNFNDYASAFAGLFSQLNLIIGGLGGEAVAAPGGFGDYAKAFETISNQLGELVELLGDVVQTIGGPEWADPTGSGLFKIQVNVALGVSRWCWYNGTQWNFAYPGSGGIP